MLSHIKSIFTDKEITIKGFQSLILKISGSLLGYILLWLVGNSFDDPTRVWGEYTLFLGVLNISSIFSRLGIDKLALKLVAAADKDLKTIRSVYFSSCKLILGISLIASTIIYSISSYIIYYLIPKSTMGIEIINMIVFILPLFSIICLNENTLRGLKMIKEFAFFQRTSKMLFSVLLFLLLFYGFNILETIVVIYAYSLALLLIFILSTLRVYRVLHKNKEKIHFIKNREIFNQSLPMMVSSSVLLLMSWTDSLMIGALTEGDYKETAVGIYNAAVKVALSATLIMSAVNSIVAPKISESYNNNRIKEFKLTIFNSTKLIFYTTLPILLIIFLFPGFILSLFGDQFAVPSAIAALLILTSSQAVNALSGSVGTILNMTGKQKVYGNILLVALAINIILNFILIDKNNYGLELGISGIEGAAVASATSLIFWNIYSVIYIYKKYNVVTSIKFKNNK